jgi:aspartyl-tRNA(Asn)/glutamyl-tRNA(Gln) amidotransferase subunit A
VPIEYNLSELTQSVRNAWLSSLTHLEKEGHSLYSVSLPSTKLALSAYYILAPAEASSNLAKYDGVRYGTRAEGPDGHDGPDGYLYANTRGQGFGPEVRRRILLGSFSLSADAIDNYFIQAQRVRRLVQEDFDQVFAVQNLLKSSSVVPDRNEPTVDVLICPTAPSTPPTLASVLENSSNSSSTDSSLAAYISDVFTVPASLAGLPAISVPVSVPKSQETDSSDLDTVGMQVIGQYGDDDLVLKVGEILEHNIFAA